MAPRRFFVDTKHYSSVLISEYGFWQEKTPFCDNSTGGGRGAEVCF